MLVSASADWLQALPAEKKDTHAHFKAAFEEKYIQPSILKFRSARKIFGKKQTIDESVDTFSNRLRNLRRKIEPDNKALLYEFLSGLKPNLASCVIQKDPQNFKYDIEAACLSELANAEAISSPTDQLLAEQFADMKREIQKLSRREESPTAAISRSASPENRGRRVTFADDGQTAMRRERSRAVSYTHLTLPTIYSV